MASQGPHYPAAAASVSAGGVAWSSPEAIEAADGVYASTVNINPGQTTDELRASGFGFAIPPDVVSIDGIVLSVGKNDFSANEGMADLSVRLRTAAGAVGADKADTVVPAGWTDGGGESTYGGPADTWGRAWTPAEINDPAFGAALRAQAVGDNGTPGVDWFRVTVYYTPVPPATGGFVRATPGGAPKVAAASGGAAKVTAPANGSAKAAATPGGGDARG